MSVIITTSWDDGDILDLKLSRLLDRYNIKGTFYITQNYKGPRLSENEIRELSFRHEIGAHTLNHPDLRVISKEGKKIEILGGKEWLEGVIGKEVKMFCYPFGFYDKETIEVVKDCGFIGARTTEGGEINKNDNHFLIPTTLHIYPFPFRKKDANNYYWRYLLQPWIQRSGKLHSLGIPYSQMTSWGRVVRTAVDIAASKGGVFHLWGHSWEIEKYNMWKELEEFFKYCQQIPDCRFVTNSQLIK